MGRMMVMATLVVALTASSLEARGPRFWRSGRRAATATRPTQPAPRGGLLRAPAGYPGPPWQRSTDDYYRAAYPKYYGGFHARELQNLGFPSSDIGLRGNGLYMGPW